MSPVWREALKKTAGEVLAFIVVATIIGVCVAFLAAIWYGIIWTVIQVF